jgi:serine/threonine protein kinase
LVVCRLTKHLRVRAADCRFPEQHLFSGVPAPVATPRLSILITQDFTHASINERDFCREPGRRNRYGAAVNSAKPLVSGTAVTVITGVREAGPGLAVDETELEAVATMSGRERSPSGPRDDGVESELPVPAGELFGGKYTLEHMFAEGGMGVVCLGRHVDLDQVVAIKFLRRALSGRPTIVQRFLNEARALAALRSEHVVRVMDVGQLESGRPYLVMEHLDGVHLQALLEQNGPLSVETAVGYAIQVCEPLAEAHALGIVHRDIKPENLFLWSGGPTADSVKVLDFGLAKQLGSSRALGVTGPQDSLGSPGYMSPEQVSTPQLVDARTDVWSLGVVLYQLLTNVSPFEGGSLVEVLSHILQASPPSLPNVVPGLDLELDAIVQRCLEKSPEARYQTMGQLADALSAYLAERQSLLHAPGRETPASLPPAKEAKIRLPGVHSRWPALIAALIVVISAAFYAADRSGQVRLRNLTDGWLTASSFDVEAPSSPRAHAYETATPFLRGVTPDSHAREANGAPAPAAIAERELASIAAIASPVAQPPLTEEERERRQAGYREYLESEGLTPLTEPSP